MPFCDSSILLLVFASKRSVRHSDKHHTTYCIDIRLDVWRWPRFLYNGFIDSVRVVGTEARRSAFVTIHSGHLYALGLFSTIIPSDSMLSHIN